MSEIFDIKAETFDRLADADIVIIEKTMSGYVVHQWSGDGVAPQSNYETAKQATARAAQLLNVKSEIKPQSWPEEVCIGRLPLQSI